MPGMVCGAACPKAALIGPLVGPELIKFHPLEGIQPQLQPLLLLLHQLCAYTL